MTFREEIGLDLFDWPDLRNGPESIIWASTAPAGHVADVRAHVLTVLAAMDRAQARRADEVCARVLLDLQEEATP